MRTEREIAELIFDKFRSAKCKTGEIVMMRTIRFSLIDKLNPKEKELFDIVFVGLQITGYITYEKDSPECIRLTQKGYDYIYDDELVSEMLNTPWIIPAYKNTDWDKTFNRLWRVIGSQDSAICYIKGPDFYNLILKFSDEIPPSYGGYIEELRKKEFSTSRVDYYKRLIDSLSEDRRMSFYGEIQTYIENHFIIHQNESINADQSLSDWEIVTMTTEEVSTPFLTDESKDSKEEHPIVFISYSWDSVEHENWVLNLATRLQSEFGIEVILDKWELKLGKPLPHFMEHAITDSQRVICVMTPNYKKKTDKLSGGVGVEYSIISSEIQKDVRTDKFIPLFRSGNMDDIPTFLAGRDFIDMRNNAEFDTRIKDLARDIWNEPKYKKPVLGAKPKFD